MALDFTFVLGKIAPVFLLLGLGAVLRWRGVLNAVADPSLMKLAVQILYPALILRYILGNEALFNLGQLWIAPLLGFVTVLAGYGAGWLASRWLPKRHPCTRQSFSLTIGIYNYGYIPIPIVLALFGEAGNATIGVLLLFNVGVEAAFWTAGIAILTAGRGSGAWKRLINPPTVTLAAALVLNQTGTFRLVPDFGYAVIDWLAACTVPVGLLLGGATLADLLRQEKGLMRDPVTPGLACLLRLGLLPLAFLLIAKFLPGLNDELRRVLVVQAAMPAGIFPLVVNRYYEGDSRTAVYVVLVTTLVGVVTIPVWLAWGLGWVF